MKRIKTNFLKTSMRAKMLFAALLFLLNSPMLSSQVNVTATGTCAGIYTLTANGTMNGKNKYTGTISGTSVDLFWNSTSVRWEINSILGVIFYNTANTPLDPPCAGNGVWESTGLCAGTTFTASSGSCTIPVELLAFSVENKDNINIMTWQTATEIKNKGFEIERSGNGKTWQTISFVGAKGNNSIYTYADKEPLPMSYYRLRQMDFDGQFDYSKVVVAKAALAKSSILVFPNPNTEGVIYIQGLSDENAEISITNIYGQVVFQQTVTSESVALNVKNVLSSGVYFVNIKTNNVLVTQKITKE